MIGVSRSSLLMALAALAVIGPWATPRVPAARAQNCLSAVRSGASAPCVWYGTVTISYDSSYDAWAVNKQGARAFRVHFESNCRVTATFKANGTVHAHWEGMKLFESSSDVEATSATITYFTPGGQPAGTLSFRPITDRDGPGQVATSPTKYQGLDWTRVKLPRFSFKATGAWNGTYIDKVPGTQQGYNLYCGFDAFIPNVYGYAHVDNGARARVIYATTPQPQPLVYSGGAYPDELWAYAQSYLPRGITLNQQQMRGQTLGRGMVQLNVSRQKPCYP